MWRFRFPQWREWRWVSSGTSETTVSNYQTIRHNNPKYSHLQETKQSKPILQKQTLSRSFLYWHTTNRRINSTEISNRHDNKKCRPLVRTVHGQPGYGLQTNRKCINVPLRLAIVPDASTYFTLSGLCQCIDTETNLPSPQCWALVVISNHAYVMQRTHYWLRYLPTTDLCLKCVSMISVTVGLCSLVLFHCRLLCSAL